MAMKFVYENLSHFMASSSCFQVFQLLWVSIAQALDQIIINEWMWLEL